MTAGLARRNAERSRALAQAGAIADRDREQAEWNLSSAEAQLADARARMVTAETQLAKTVLRAPFSGMVSERPVNLGDIVQNGTQLFTVVDPATLKLEGTVEADALDRLKVGTPVTFAIHGAEKPITGRISRINPVVDPATRQVRVTVALPNAAGHVIAGLFAEGRVATSSRTSVVVPNGAVDRKGLRPFVVRLKGGRVERVEIELGVIDAAKEQMEVRTGLVPGDTLLLGGARGIAPGTAVQVGNVSERE
jgi:RND family efflux transporter MFP subunit